MATRSPFSSIQVAMFAVGRPADAVGWIAGEAARVTEDFLDGPGMIGLGARGLGQESKGGGNRRWGAGGHPSGERSCYANEAPEEPGSGTENRAMCVKEEF